VGARSTSIKGSWRKGSAGAVLLISEDLDEIFALSDRIVVIFEGEVMGEAVVEEASREQIAFG